MASGRSPNTRDAPNPPVPGFASEELTFHHAEERLHNVQRQPHLAMLRRKPNDGGPENGNANPSMRTTIAGAFTEKVAAGEGAHTSQPIKRLKTKPSQADQTSPRSYDRSQEIT